MSFRTCPLRQHIIILCALSLFFLVPLDGMASPKATFARIHTRNSTDGNIPVLTYKYDNERTGEDSDETHLDVDNVNSQQFGRLISYPVDGQIYGQPLYVPHVQVGSVTRNLVFVVTERNSAYAFDADDTSGEATPLWHTSFLDGSSTLIWARGMNCPNVTPVLGITSTPVIDSATSTLFLASYVDKNNAFTYELHALDLATGHEKANSPLIVRKAGFNSYRERQRAGLLLANGRIYLAFASFCDYKPYHGWILGYSFDGAGFHLRNAYNATPTGTEGGIWSGGSAIAADENGNIYAMTGNGTFDLNQGGRNAGDSFLKLSPDLHLIDYFTPFNQRCLNFKDKDLGSGGPLITPDDWLLGGGKEGSIYVISTHHMGHFRSVAAPCEQQNASDLNPIQQELILNPPHAIFSTPVYWHGPGEDYVFVARVRDHTQALRFSQGHLDGPVSATPEIFDYSGGNPVVSSNGSEPGTGILWTIVAPGYLRAYDATDLSHELYSGAIGAYNKFVPPVVSNGKVFIATQNSLKIYGLLKPTTRNQPGQPTPTSRLNPPTQPTPAPQLTSPAQPRQPAPTPPPNPTAQPEQPVPTIPPDPTLQTDLMNMWGKQRRP